MYDVYCISAGQIDVKKDSNIINKRNMYLNYGLLGLASIIESHRLSTIQLHGHFTEPEKFVNHCESIGMAKTTFPVFISLPSFYALSWVRAVTKLLKEKLKVERIVLGGRWVIDGEPELLAAYLPHVDNIVDGLGENKIQKFLNLPKSISATSVKGYLNYNLLENRELFQPSLEVSRGCGMECSFCQEANEPLTSLKPPSIIIEESQGILLSDDLRQMSPYFEASIFKPTARWLNELILQRELNSSTFFWRAESRVDSIPKGLIPLMFQAGLRVLDLGLESGSHIQLKRMGKSTYPAKYLERASQILKLAYEVGIDVKVNVLLYAGETNRTIDETVTWLDIHRKYITGVSVGPVIAFGWEKKKKEFVTSLESLGARVSNNNDIVGVTLIDLSSQISSKESLIISKQISQEFMTHEEYFKLKSFSYFPRDYTFSDFEDDIKLENGVYSFRHNL